MICNLFRRLFYLLQNLKLAHTLRNLKYCPHPLLTFWKLFWPLPWRYTLPTPLDSLEIRDHPDIVHQRYYVHENYRRLRSIPLFQLRDTPLRSLYRLHDVLCADEQNYIMLEGHYFWRRSGWRIKDIPDPKDPNPLRYAILASLVESMVEAYNWKISLGLRRGVGMTSAAQDEAPRKDPNKPFEEAPSWTSLVPPVEEWTSFLPDRAITNYNTPFHTSGVFVLMRISCKISNMTRSHRRLYYIYQRYRFYYSAFLGREIAERAYAQIHQGICKRGVEDIIAWHTTPT